MPADKSAPQMDYAVPTFSPPIDRSISLARPQQPVRLRELIAVFLMVIIGDITIYRGYGLSGLALFFAAAPGILWLGSDTLKRTWHVWAVAIMLAVLSLKMFWLGSGLLVFCGLVLLVAFGMSLSGYRPFVLEAFAFGWLSLHSGLDGLRHYGRNIKQIGMPMANLPWLSVILPITAFLGFGLIFVLANPNLMTSFSQVVSNMFEGFSNWLTGFSFFEILFWCFVVWVTVGFLRPRIFGRQAEGDDESPAPEATTEECEPVFFPAFRNTLITVIGLFAVYLVFEFATLWFREFPEGFYYAGYAHQGAAWLTVALALATVVLSLVFRGTVLRDPRVAQLRTLAWIWSVQNFILALAVYNRLFIYIDFNGMTWMRTVGLFGTTTVVVGFVVVLWKINHNRSFTWLVRRQLLTLAMAIFLFALTPVDAIAHNYNVNRVLAGDLAPSVQISRHPINSEGFLYLQPLLQCEDPIIREGIRAMLAQRHEQVRELIDKRQDQGWTSYQLADSLVAKRLQENQTKWSAYMDDTTSRDEAIQRFRDYAYQWW